MDKRPQILEDEMLRREEYENILHLSMQSILSLIKENDSKCKEDIYVTYCDTKSRIIISSLAIANSFFNDLDNCEQHIFCFQDENECRCFSKDIFAWLKKAYPHCKMVSSLVRVPELQSEMSLVFHFNLNKS